jgi:hypothetical protein
MTTEARVIGTDIIRRAMANRVKKHESFGRLKNDLGAPDDALRKFAEGADNLSA